MTTIMPQSELLKRAVEFILAEKACGSKKKDMELIDEASMRFNLSPADSLALLRLLTDEKE